MFLPVCTAFVLIKSDPRAMIYGDQYTLLYNEACVPIWGSKHPQALGRSPSVAFAELWPAVRNSFDQAYRDGKSTKVHKIEVLIRRRNDMIVSSPHRQGLVSADIP